MLSNEQPIKTREEDFLSRKYFADHISNAIINYKDKNNDSLTIGLYGKWGSGKTSLINMAIESLGKKDDIIILNFEPWLFSDTNQLISSFFKEFSQKINHNTNDSGDMKSLGNKLEAYACFFEPLTLVPEPSVSLISKGMSYAFSWAGKTYKKVGESYKQDLSSIKKEIEEQLNKLDKKILIIIDDIDRLNNTEIKQIFQLIKSLGNFPNTIYLSSMDKNVVVNALSEVQHGDGNEYLEKIINVPIEVPQLSKTDVDKFLFNKLNEIIKNIDEKDFDQNYWGNIFYSGYKNFFTNIRDVIRYINILRFNYNSLQNHVNIIDLMVITAFQVFEPEVYSFFKHNKSLLSGQESDSSSTSGYRIKEENQNNLKAELDKCKKRLQNLDDESFINLLQELFLKVKEAYSNTTYIGELSRLRKNSKVSSPQFYDAYFTLTLTEELSNVEIKEIINKTSNEIDFSNIILELIEDGRVFTFLKRIQDFTGEDIPKENFQTIFNVLMNLGDMIPENREGMYSLGSNMEIMRVFYQLNMQLESELERYNILKESIEKSKKSLYTLCHQISLLMQKHGEYDKEREQDEKFITNDQLQDLKKLLLNKIDSWISNRLLFEHIEALYIMYLWKRIDENSCLKYINTNSNSEEKVLKFLQAFIYHSFSHTMGDYTEKKEKKFNYKGLNDFIDAKLIISDIKAINKKLSEDEQFCIEKFIGYYENKINDDNY